MAINLFGKLDEVREELKKRIDYIKEEDVEKLQKKAIEVIDLTTMILDGFKHNLQKKIDEKEATRSQKATDVTDTAASDNTDVETNETPKET